MVWVMFEVDLISSPLTLICLYLIWVILFLFAFSYFIQSRLFQPQLTLWQLIQPDLEPRFVFRFQLVPRIQSGSSPSAGLQKVTQSSHLSKNCYLPTRIESTPFQNSASKVAGLLVHASTPDSLSRKIYRRNIVQANFQKTLEGA